MIAAQIPVSEPGEPHPKPAPKTTGQGIVGGAAWIIFTRMADRVVGLISTLILARVLMPADFGLVAMAMSVISLIELASAFGFEVSLVRAKNPSRELYDTVWTLNLAFGWGCACITAIAAVPVAALYRDHRLVAVMLALAVSWAISATGNVGTVDFRRNLDFMKEFRWIISARLAGFVVTITSALLLHSYWALIAGTLTMRMVNVLLSYAWHPFRPRLSFGATRELFAFSVWIFLERLANFGNSRSSDFVLGRIQGPAELGIYRLGEEIGYLPGTELVAPINRVLLPGMSRMAHGGQSMVELLLGSTGIVMTLLAPACLGLAALADPLVRALLGPKWLSTIPIVEIMAMNALFAALWASQSVALYATGSPKVPGSVAIGRLFIYAPTMAMLAPAMGARGAALAALISSAVSVAVGIGFTLPRLSLPTGRFLSRLWRPLLAGAALFAAARGVVLLIGPAEKMLGTVMTLATGTLVGAITYTACLLLLYFIVGRPDGAEKEILRYLAEMKRKRFGPASI